MSTQETNKHRILVTGGTGFVGRALVARLIDAGHSVRVLTRQGEGARPIVGAHAEIIHPDRGMDEAVRGIDTVINLAGENIFKGRWSKARKAALVSSRVDLTTALVEAANSQPSVNHFISTSAVGFYGDRGDESLDESSAPGGDFLADLCQAWEEAAHAFRGRTTIMRLGIVLGTEDGALATMLTPFKLGLGGKLGNGQQYMSWVHKRDVIEAFAAAVDAESMEGIHNLTAPKPVTNEEFTIALGRAIRRPTILPAPAFGLKLLLGESAEALLGGQRALPNALQSRQFKFNFPEIRSALADLVGGGAERPALA